MGRKRSRTWEYLYLFIACVTFLSFTGCATLIELETRMKGREHLLAAQNLFEQGDYEGSLKENQAVLSLCDNTPPGDEALFNMALIYAHHGYRGRDLRKSLDHFEGLVKLFPQSPFAPQAKIWSGLIHDIQRMNEEIEEVNESLRKSREENERLMKEIEELNKTIRKSKQVDIEIDEKKKEISK